MGELKRIRVRKATMRDSGLFKKLWLKMMEEQHAAGSLVLPNEANLAVMVNLFEKYVTDELDGVVLFVSNVGVLMYGDMGHPFELSVGDRVAFGWGQFVAEENRGKGVLDKMVEEAFKQLKIMGFDVMLGNTMVKDIHGAEAFARVVEQNGFEVEDSGERPCFVRFSKE